MPLVELEDRELARLRSIERDHDDAAKWRQAWGQVVNDPATKLDAWRVFKKKYPDIAVPELDTVEAASAPILAELEALKKQIAEDREASSKASAEREERDREKLAKETISQSRRRLRGDGWDDEAIEKIEALMQERGIGDYDVAAAYVRSQMPKPAPLNNAYEGRDLNWFNPGDDEPDSKLLMDNPRKFKTDMVKKFMSDKANGNLAGWAA
jgi:hypothetical protein